MCFEVEFNQTGGIIWFDLTARGLNLHNSGGSRMINIIYIGDLSPAYCQNRRYPHHSIFPNQLYISWQIVLFFYEDMVHIDNIVNGKQEQIQI